LMIHAHAIVFTGWLVLLAAQILLIRRKNFALHKKLGLFSLILLPLMIVLGLAAAFARIHARIQAHMPDAMINHTLSFLSTQVTNVVGAAVLIGAGILLRKNAASHKRLMLMGTVALTEAGFSRFLHQPLSLVFGDGFWPYIVETYVGTILLIVAIGVYDMTTRRRLHPVYVVSAIWILANEAIAAWLYYQPGWLSFTKHLVGY